jgi:hypothetical protein
MAEPTETTETWTFKVDQLFQAEAQVELGRELSLCTAAHLLHTRLTNIFGDLFL